MKPIYTKGAFERFDSPNFEAFAQVLHDFQIETAKVRQPLNRYDGSDYIWRGQRSAEDGLQASAMRGVHPAEAHALEEMDLKTFVQAASALGLTVPETAAVTTEPGFNAEDSETNRGRLLARWRATALAQHYGVPTTLLDWSRSSSTALGHAVWDAIKFLAKCDEKDLPSWEAVPRIALWQLDPSDTQLRFVKIVLNPDPHNPRQRDQRGVYTQVEPNDEFPTGDILEIAKATPTAPALLRCFTFPGHEMLIAYQWLLGQNVSPGTAYGGYEGAAQDAMTERYVRSIRKRCSWAGRSLGRSL